MGDNNLVNKAAGSVGSLHNYFPLLVILLLSIVVGMVFALVIRPKDVYHGPNSKEVRKQIFYDPKKNKCFKFDVKIMDCPKNFRKN